jgi:hypothetical protein
MAVSGNFPAIVEIVEHAELQREFVLVGRDVCAIHGERWIAVAHRQVAENLIVGAIFLEDVDHVADGILSAGKVNLAADRSGEIVFFDLAGVGRRDSCRCRQGRGAGWSRRSGSDVGMLFRIASPLSVPSMLLGPLPSPLAVAMRRSLPAMASALGYHSVGMKPMGLHR